MRIGFLKEKVKKVRIRDYKVIKKADIEFKDGLNIIIGRGGTGKTILIDYLMREFDQMSNIMPLYQKKILEIDGFIGLYETLLIDNDLLPRLYSHHRVELLIKLAQSKKQIIIVGYYDDEKLLRDKRKEFKCNIIDTRDFELKK